MENEFKIIRLEDELRACRAQLTMSNNMLESVLIDLQEECRDYSDIAQEIEDYLN